jgi:ribonuclease P protein component
VPDGAGTPPRVAYTVGRKVGSAVARNRLRRQLRAAAGEAGLVSGAYLISASPPAATMTFGELRETVRAAATAVTAGDEHR